MAHGFIRIIGEDFPKTKKENTENAEIAQTANLSLPAPNVKDCSSGLSSFEYKICLIIDGNKLSVWKGSVFRKANEKYAKVCREAKRQQTQNVVIELWQNDFRLERYVRE